VERRLSFALAAAGLIGAIGIFLLGRRTSSDDVLRTVAADLDALIRENAAGVKERADTLAQLPRISWAVATDEATVRDLTNEELAFRTHPGEHIEITQMQKGGGEPRRLLRRPADSDIDLPLMVGTHVVVRDNRLQLVTVVSIEPHEHADQVVGLLAVAKQLDTSALEQRLVGRRISAEVQTIQGAFVLAGSAPAPSRVEAKVALTGPAAQGTVLVASNLGAPRWPRVVAPLVLLLSLAGAALLWRRGAGSIRLSPHEIPFARGFDETTSSEDAARPTAPAAPPAVAPPAPPPPLRPPLLARSTTPAPGTRPARTTPVEPPPRPGTPPLGAKAAYPEARLPTPARSATKATPVAGLAALPDEAVPVPIEAFGRSGRVDTSLIRTGSVSLPPRGAGPPAPPPAPKPDGDPRAEQYRNLFAEFVKLRRTTGESVDDLDANHFVATLREKRAQIMKQLPVKDVQFKLAFHNGKAAIRYLTVT